MRPLHPLVRGALATDGLVMRCPDCGDAWLDEPYALLWLCHCRGPNQPMRPHPRQRLAHLVYWRLNSELFDHLPPVPPPPAGIEVWTDHMGRPIGRVVPGGRP